MAMNRVLVLCLAAFFVCSLLFEATTAVRYIPYPVLTRIAGIATPGIINVLKITPPTTTTVVAIKLTDAGTVKTAPRLPLEQVDPEDKGQELRGS
ncbi:hypothetical protein IFM89_014397 [Coptis chinensis]|uniref:Uncharacterized protein n=1 Tax=Coptis chinensis TaxID=261450 RepID=A0A835GW72_9MAGN|nr:hypothetical protein IFM89_014397 [Coptis chinensis]